MADPITWLRFEESFFDPHPKVYRLAAALDIDVAAATVQVAKLWFFTARYDRSDYHGRITEHVDQLDRQVFDGVKVGHLVDAGLVDVDPETGNLYVHDWYETNGRYLEKYQKERDRKRKARAKAADESADRPRTGGEPSADSPTRRDEDGTRTKPDATPTVDGGGQGGGAEAVENVQRFPQADVFLEIPALATHRDPTPVTFKLCQGTVDSIQDAYPSVDVLAVAHDMNRKLRSGARDLYTVRGMPKALAGWVASAAVAGEHRKEPTE